MKCIKVYPLNFPSFVAMHFQDCYQLILELDKIARHDPNESEVISALRRYHICLLFCFHLRYVIYYFFNQKMALPFDTT